jgi:uncharacterized membrane protein YhaH (DUF805 family)
MAMDIKQEVASFTLANWLSFKGRISRKTWWLHYVLLMIPIFIVLAIIVWILNLVLGAVLPNGVLLVLNEILMLCFNLALSLPGLAGLLKRLHDHNLDDIWGFGYFGLSLGYQVLNRIFLLTGLLEVGFISILMGGLGLLVAVAGITMLVFCGFLPGKPGPNRYGPDPLGGNPMIGAHDQATIIPPRR